MVVYHFDPYSCNWLPVNPFLFQIANIMLVLTYIVPDNLNGLFMLRFFLGTSGLFFALWAWWNICAPDTLGWNVCFMIGNYVHAIYMFINIKRPRKFSEHCEVVYEKLFQPLGVQRFQFQKLADSSSVIELKSGEAYAYEGDQALRISILLRGLVEVRNGNKVVHVTKPVEFMDSPEWASHETEHVAKYGISLFAQDDILFVQWQNDVLRKILKKDRFLKNVFDSLIGQDVTKKLLSLTRMVGDEELNSTAYRVDSLLYLHQELIKTNSNNLHEGVLRKNHNTSLNTVSRFDSSHSMRNQSPDNTPLLSNRQLLPIRNGTTFQKVGKLFSTPSHEETPLMEAYVGLGLGASDIHKEEDRETVL